MRINCHQAQKKQNCFNKERTRLSFSRSQLCQEEQIVCSESPKIEHFTEFMSTMILTLCDACPFVGFAFFPIYHEVCNYFLFHDPMEHKSPTSNFLTGKKNFCVYLLQNKRVLNTGKENRNDIQGFLIKLILNVYL